MVNGDLRPVGLKSIPRVPAPVEGIRVATVKRRFFAFEAKEVAGAGSMTKQAKERKALRHRHDRADRGLSRRLTRSINISRRVRVFVNQVIASQVLRASLDDASEHNLDGLPRRSRGGMTGRRPA